MLSLRSSLVAVCVIIVAGLGVWTANAALTQVTVVYTIDENNPATTSTPVTDECSTGVPCKLQSVLTVADANQPSESLTSISPTAFQGATGLAVPNGTFVGITRIVAKYSANGQCTDLIKPTIDLTADFLDGGIKGEVADDDSAAALENTGVWPTRLEADLRVSELMASGHQVVRRSVAVMVYAPPLLPEIRTPINLLSFDVSDGNGFAGLTTSGIYNVAVGGDPTVEPAGGMCSPSTSTGLLLGQSAAGLTLQSCRQSGIHTFTNVLTRDVGGALQIDATVSDTVRCLLVVGGTAEMPDTSDSSGESPPLVYASLAAAAGLGVLTAGTWYARRRRLR